MKSLLGLALTVLLLLGVFFTPTAAAGDIIKVMTQNQYLGADLTPLIEAAVGGSLKDFIAAVEDAFTQIAINNFPLRAQRLATEVALSNPDAIALQEVIDLKLNGENPGPPYVDHLTETLDALAAKGLYYVVAAKVINLNITMPIGPSDINGDLVSIVDRDVILVREGVAFTALSGYYDPNEPTLGPLCGVPVSNPVPVLPFPPTLESTVSEDGCNYTAVAEFKSPLIGKITINRGFVGVDVTVRGEDYRVVNTHLEVRELLSDAKFSRIFQYLQSEELIETLRVTTPEGLTLILLGDFNSCDEDMSIFIGPFEIFPPYQVIIDHDAGFLDIWAKNPLKLLDPYGFTCCQDADLLNKKSLLDERIDIIFVLDKPLLPLALVTGRVPIFPLYWPPNWASDHGGVFAKLIFR